MDITTIEVILLMFGLILLMDIPSLLFKTTKVGKIARIIGGMMFAIGVLLVFGEEMGLT